MRLGAFVARGTRTMRDSACGRTDSAGRRHRGRKESQVESPTILLARGTAHDERGGMTPVLIPCSPERTKRGWSLMTSVLAQRTASEGHR